MCTRGIFADPKERDGKGTSSRMDESLEFEIKEKLNGTSYDDY
jgi:hypothetical protein